MYPYWFFGVLEIFQLVKAKGVNANMAVKLPPLADLVNRPC